MSDTNLHPVPYVVPSLGPNSSIFFGFHCRRPLSDRELVEVFALLLSWVMFRWVSRGGCSVLGPQPFEGLFL